MAELFTFTLGRDIEVWLEIQHQLQPLARKYLEEERDKEYPSSSNMDALLQQNATISKNMLSNLNLPSVNFLH